MNNAASRPETVDLPDWQTGTLAWCLQDGAIKQVASAHVSILDRSFLYGDGLFETLRIHQEQPVRWDAHWTRLKSGCDALGIPLNIAKETLRQDLKQLIEKNKYPHSMARIHVSRGPGPRGYRMPTSSTTGIIVTLHTAPDLPDEQPVSWDMTVATLRSHTSWKLHDWKTCNKLFQILVQKEATAKGVDDALVLNEFSHITESSAANLFFIQNGVIKTPSKESGILLGTTRQFVQEWCEANQVSFEETVCPLNLIQEADSAFATLASYGIVHIRKIDQHHYPMHPLEIKLYQHFLEQLEMH